MSSSAHDVTSQAAHDVTSSAHKALSVVSSGVHNRCAALKRRFKDAGFQDGTHFTLRSQQHIWEPAHVDTLLSDYMSYGRMKKEMKEKVAWVEAFKKTEVYKAIMAAAGAEVIQAAAEEQWCSGQKQGSVLTLTGRSTGVGEVWRDCTRPMRGATSLTARAFLCGARANANHARKRKVA